MRDYQFGEWLATLRISNGYSQFQLGKLLGVSDKAVSKWETGAAKPRTATCTRIASIYGITLDDLMACEQAQGISRMRSEQSQAEEPLWQMVWARLRRIYGDNPPAAFTSRLDAEEILMRGTGLIEHLNLKAQLWRRGISNDNWFTMEASLTAWLLGAAFVNPLPPHTVCPRCGKTVLHPEVRDGWDLPEQRCTCGTSLHRDGHRITLSVTEKRFQEMDRRLMIGLHDRDKSAFLEVLGRQYQHRWELVEYKHAQGEGTLASLLGIAGRYFVLKPTHVKLPFPVMNGICQLPSDDYVFRIMDTPEALLYIGIDPDDEGETEKPIPDVPALDHLLKADMMQRIAEEAGTVPEITLAMYDDCAVDIRVPRNFVDKTGTMRHIEWFGPENISEYLPADFNFSALMQVSSANFNRLWYLFARDRVAQGEITLSEFPLAAEDLFDCIKENMLRVGIQDNGIAFKALTSMQDSGPSPEIAQALLSIGCKPWLPAYIEFVGKYLQKESKVQSVISAYCRLFRAVVSQQDDEEEGPMPIEQITTSVMMQWSATVHELDNK